MDPAGSILIHYQTGFRLIDRVVKEYERSLVNEDQMVISGGERMETKQELQELEDHINYASFLLAAGVSNPQRIDDWISAARKTAFCLADQIAMYAIRGSSNSQLYHMKYDIGMPRMAELTKSIKRHNTVGEEEGQMPDVVHTSSEDMPQLPEMSPFISCIPSVPADALIRMDDKIKKIEEFFKDDHPPVLFVTGGQGSGKTTLMKDVYQGRMNAVDGTDQCCWVDIAETGGLVSLLQTVLKELNVDCESIHEFELINMVHETLKGKRCLIVLDNVQDTSVLYSLKTILQNLKWKIICLTRRYIKEDKDQDVLHIPGLQPYDSLKLLLSAAFPNFNSTNLQRENVNSTVREDVLREAITSKYSTSPRVLQSHQLVKMVKLLNGILSKCHDNPSTIWSIGTLLQVNPVEKCEEIAERIDGMLVDGTKMYENRDPRIQLEDAKLADAATRHCFLYCLAFPKISESSETPENSGGIPTRKLIRLWTAEGYVQDNTRQSKEQEAERMLDELIMKNLLVAKKIGLDGRVLKCSVNEHIRPLAEKMCEQQKFCKIVVDDADEASSPSRMTKCLPVSLNILARGKKKPLSDRYRMVAVHGDRGVKEVPKTLGKDIRLRSLLCVQTGRIEQSKIKLTFGRTYMLLRTLELEGARLANLPPHIDCLACLRYLGLRNTQLETLPLTLPRLTHLMCLDIRDNNIREVADVSQFEEMRHLYLTKSFRGHSVAIRNGLHSLVNLQTLSGAAHGGSSGIKSFEEQISRLQSLRKLSVKKASCTSSKYFCEAINGIEPLQSLAISCDRDGPAFDLSALRIRKDLRKLKLGGPMAHLCDLVPLMQSITFLHLWDSKLPGDLDLLHALRGLTNLIVLSLLNTSTSEEISCDNGYKKLKRLSIVSMENLSVCNFGRKAMWNLEELVFAKCGKLRRLPRGLDQLGSLREVHLSEMPPDFCTEAKDKLRDKVYILRDTLSHVASSRAATGGGS